MVIYGPKLVQDGLSFGPVIGVLVYLVDLGRALFPKTCVLKKQIKILLKFLLSTFKSAF